MALKVVGAGLGRTGTNTLKVALEQLGYDRCHHMFEVIDNPKQIAYWHAAAMGDTPDWNAVFEGFQASVDWPSAFFWRELTAHYPDAKVLLSVRPEAAWLKSIQSTIFPVIRTRRDIPPGNMHDAMAMGSKLVLDRTFGGNIDDPDHVLSVYRAHIAAVRQTIAPGRLLVFDVAEGWEPLCRFLGVAVPATPFPVTNTTKDFQEHVASPPKA